MVDGRGSGGGTTAEKVLQATAELLDRGGVEAVSTRAVAAAAGVQPPVIYRQFGDKDGLLDAVTYFVLEKYILAKRRIVAASIDPIEELRRTWDLHVEFGLKHPDAYMLAYVVPRRHGKSGAAAKETVALLHGLIAQVGDQGRLRMSVERATNLMYGTGLGTVLTLMPLRPSERDPKFSEVARESALSAILVHDEDLSTKGSKLPARAVALAEALRGTEEIAASLAERALLLEWLDRLADHTR